MDQHVKGDPHRPRVGGERKNYGAVLMQIQTYLVIFDNSHSFQCHQTTTKKNSNVIQKTLYF